RAPFPKTIGNSFLVCSIFVAHTNGWNSVAAGNLSAIPFLFADTKTTGCVPLNCRCSSSRCQYRRRETSRIASARFPGNHFHPLWLLPPLKLERSLTRKIASQSACSSPFECAKLTKEREE